MWASFQSRIVAKLRAEMTAGVKVNTAAEVADVTDKAQLAPGVIVIYGGATMSDEPGGANSPVAQMQMEFFVCALARNMRGSGTTDAAAASELCDEIIGALLGFDLGITPEKPKGTGHFLRLGQPLPPQYDGGYCMAPLSFSVRRTVRSNTVT